MKRDRFMEEQSITLLFHFNTKNSCKFCKAFLQIFFFIINRSASAYFFELVANRSQPSNHHVAIREAFSSLILFYFHNFRFALRNRRYAKTRFKVGGKALILKSTRAPPFKCPSKLTYSPNP